MECYMFIRLWGIPNSKYNYCSFFSISSRLTGSLTGRGCINHVELVIKPTLTFCSKWRKWPKKKLLNSHMRDTNEKSTDAPKVEN